MKNMLMILAVMLILCPATSFAQAQKDEIFYVVDVMPQFPGGEEGLKEFLAKNTMYPELAKENEIEGKVFVRFVVSKSGKINNATIVRGADQILDREALRVVNSLPKWKPGLLHNKPVNVWYTVPINFRLTTNKNKEVDGEEESPISKNPNETYFYSVDVAPEFPGGLDSLKSFIAKNTQYPQEAIENNIQGKVFVRFIVTLTGQIDKVNVVRGVDPLIDKEAIRVVSSLPKWTPGKQKGKAVNVWYTVPVDFKLEN